MGHRHQGAGYLLCSLTLPLGVRCICLRLQTDSRHTKMDTKVLAPKAFSMLMSICATDSKRCKKENRINWQLTLLQWDSGWGLDCTVWMLQTDNRPVLGGLTAVLYACQWERAPLSHPCALSPPLLWVTHTIQQYITAEQTARLSPLLYLALSKSTPTLRRYTRGPLSVWDELVFLCERRQNTNAEGR
jgi:hypothetical protein